MADAVVEFRSVEKKFVEGDTTRMVLKRVTGEVREGETLTLVGPSGSGKSTLLSLCNLLLTPDDGEVYILGREVREWSIPQLRRTVGMVFQTPTVFPGTVFDNLNLGPKLHGETLTNPEKWLEAVDLPRDWLSRTAEELSGGQRQRIALARTLINEPQILLLDEVTSALDPVSTQVVESLIVKWKEETGGSVLWVTHHLHQARRQGSYTWYLEDGELVEGNETEKLFENPTDERTRGFLSQQSDACDEPAEGAQSQSAEGSSSAEWAQSAQGSSTEGAHPVEGSSRAVRPREGNTK